MRTFGAGAVERVVTLMACEAAAAGRRPSAEEMAGWRSVVEALGDPIQTVTISIGIPPALVPGRGGYR